MVQSILRGHFSRPGLRRYLLFMAGTFWALIGLAWLSYPEENHYSIMSHTFSFLGSYEEEHNPRWWWIFSVAMMFWALSMAPIIQYFYRRFAIISRSGAVAGAFLFSVGSVGIAIVALFPDVKAPIFGVRITEIHEKGAILTAIGFVLGILLHGGLLIYNRFSTRHEAFRMRKLAGPYLLWSGMVFAAAYNQVSWGITYERMKRDAAAAGQQIRSSWGESLNTIYAFPLWENLVIYTLFAFLVWFALAVPAEAPASARIQRDTGREP